MTRILVLLLTALLATAPVTQALAACCPMVPADTVLDNAPEAMATPCHGKQARQHAMTTTPAFLERAQDTNQACDHGHDCCAVAVGLPAGDVFAALAIAGADPATPHTLTLKPRAERLYRPPRPTA